VGALRLFTWRVLLSCWLLLATLLGQALPIWERMLLPGGTLALAWNATRIERAAMVELIERCTRLRVRNEPPYTQLEHAVDRVIKKRDIVVGVRPGSDSSDA